MKEGRKRYSLGREGKKDEGKYEEGGGEEENKKGGRRKATC